MLQQFSKTSGVGPGIEQLKHPSNMCTYLRFFNVANLLLLNSIFYYLPLPKYSPPPPSPNLAQHRKDFTVPDTSCHITSHILWKEETPQEIKWIKHDLKGGISDAPISTALIHPSRGSLSHTGFSHREGTALYESKLYQNSPDEMERFPFW